MVTDDDLMVLIDDNYGRYLVSLMEEGVVKLKWRSVIDRVAVGSGNEV